MATDPASRNAPRASPKPRLSKLSYRSHSAVPMSELELYRLMKNAQQRNRAEGVTSLMVYDKGWIFQQLEGPSEGLARVWDSIRQDSRHVDVEILNESWTPERLYTGWDLKLSVHGASAGQPAHDWAEHPSELISRYYRGEEAGRAGADTQAPTRVALTHVLGQLVIPRLNAALQPQALARLLIAPDKAAAVALVKAAHATRNSLEWLTADLLEPGARSLGDLWQTDDCSELDVSLGLVRLQGIVRELGADAPRVSAVQAPMVLVVPQPGEAHILSAALDAEMLWRAGWNPHLDFPSSSGALDALLANTWVDALDLSMSTALRREHRLGQLGETIAHARLASLNPNLVIVVSGRAFVNAGSEATAQSGAAGRGVGADASFGSAIDAELTILTALHLPGLHQPRGS